MGGKLGTAWGAEAGPLEDVGEDDTVSLIATFLSRTSESWKTESHN